MITGLSGTGSESRAVQSIIVVVLSLTDRLAVVKGVMSDSSCSLQRHIHPERSWRSKIKYDGRC